MDSTSSSIPKLNIKILEIIESIDSENAKSLNELEFKIPKVKLTKEELNNIDNINNKDGFGEYADPLEFTPIELYDCHLANFQLNFDSEPRLNDLSLHAIPSRLRNVSNAIKLKPISPKSSISSSKSPLSFFTASSYNGPSSPRNDNEVRTKATSFANFGTKTVSDIVKNLITSNSGDLPNIHLSLDVKHCMFKPGDASELTFSLYSQAYKQFITEEYMVKLTENGFPEINTAVTKCLFANLNLNDFLSDLYIVCKIVRVGRLLCDEKKKTGIKNDDLLKRPYGVSVLHLTPYLDTLFTTSASGSELVPPNVDIFTIRNENQFYNLHSLILNKSDQIELAPMSLGLAWGIQVYSDVNCPSQLRPFSIPEIIYNLPTCRRTTNFDTSTDISSILTDGAGSRNQLYLSILDGEFDQGRKTSSKNIQVKVTLCSSGRPIENSIYNGIGPMSTRTTSFHSTVLYHTNNPRYDENFSIVVPTNAAVLENYYFHFEFFHCSSKSENTLFAIGYLGLIVESTGALLADSDHILRIFEPTCSFSAYYCIQQNVPPNVAACMTSQIFRVRSRLISTKVSLDPNIHALINWKHYLGIEKVQIEQLKSLEVSANDVVAPPSPTFGAFTQEKFAKCLTNIALCPSNKIANLLPEILTALFNILDSSRNDVHEAAFYLLASIFADMSSGHSCVAASTICKFYMDNLFESTKAFEHLLKFIRLQIEWTLTPNPQPTDSSFKIVCNTFKGSPMLWEFISNSFLRLLNNGSPIQYGDLDSRQLNIVKYTQELIQGIIAKMCTLMTLNRPAFISSVQGFVLKNAIHVYAALSNFLFKRVRISELACDFFSCIRLDKIILNNEKLLFIKDFLTGEVAKDNDALYIVLKSVFNQIRFHLNRDADERITSITLLKYIFTPLKKMVDSHPQILSILMDLPSILEICKDFVLAKSYSPDKEDKVSPRLLRVSRHEPASSKQLYSRFGQRMFNPFLMHRWSIDVSSSPQSLAVFMPLAAEDTSDAAMFRKMQDSKLLPDCFAILYHMVELMHDTYPEQKDLFLERISDITSKAVGDSCDPHKRDLINIFYENAFEVGEALVKESVYPKEWLLMRQVELRTILFMLQDWICPLMIRHFTFLGGDERIWEGFLCLSLSFLSCEDLEPYAFGIEKRNYMLDNYEDYRLSLIKTLNHCWYKVMGKNRLKFLNILVPRLLQLTQHINSDIAVFSRNWYFDLLLLEFEDSGAIRSVEYNTIDAVDTITRELCEQKRVSGVDDTKIIAGYVRFFNVELKKRLQSDQKLFELLQPFLNDIKGLFAYLVALQSLPKTRIAEIERTTATLQLMQYLKQCNRQDMYIKYVIYLWQLHDELENNTEKGLALVLHEKLHTTWSDSQFCDAIENLPRESVKSRRLALYYSAISAFDKAECWERSVKLCQELADIYQNVLFDLPALSSILRQQALFIDKIYSKDRIFRSFYRVAFFGKGFSPDIMGKEYVYRSGNGCHLESVKDFTDRIKLSFPLAIVVNSPDLPAEEICKNEIEGQYIQITTLTCSSVHERDEQLNPTDNEKIPLRMRKYMQNNDVNIFLFSRMYKEREKFVEKKKNGNEYRELWVCKTYIETQDTLPFLERRSLVVSRKEVILSPIENAVINIRLKNKELIELINLIDKTDHNDVVDVGPVSMQLSGVIDAAVQGGVLKYREAFFEDDYLKQYPSHAPFLDSFRDVLQHQIFTLEKGMKVFTKRCPANLTPLLEHLEVFFGRMREAVAPMLSVN